MKGEWGEAGVGVPRGLQERAPKAQCVQVGGRELFSVVVGWDPRRGDTGGQ